MIDQARLEAMIKAFSDWVDTSPANIDRNPEALMWHRISKPAEEAGEVINEMIIATGGNPRKGDASGDYEAMIHELYDTANAALGAIVHVRGTADGLLDGLAGHVTRVNERVGVYVGDECNCDLMTGFIHRRPLGNGHTRDCPQYKAA